MNIQYTTSNIRLKQVYKSSSILNLQAYALDSTNHYMLCLAF